MNLMDACQQILDSSRLQPKPLHMHQGVNLMQDEAARIHTLLRGFFEMIIRKGISATGCRINRSRDHNGNARTTFFVLMADAPTTPTRKKRVRQFP